MIETIGKLLGMDLAVCNQDLVLIISAIFLLLIVNTIYDLVMLIFGYIGGRKR